MLHLSSLFLRICFVFLGVLGILCFLSPCFFSIVNIGNLFGLTVSVCVLCIGIWLRPLTGLLQHISRYRSGAIALKVIVCLLAAGILYCIVMSCCMIHAANKKPPEPPKAIIVLGCKVRGTVPSLMLFRRIQAAYDALQEYPDAIAIVSGGKGENENISEAECMENELVRMGISKERIIQENQSTSTSENLRFSKPILEEKGIDKNVLIVTDGYHELRAQYLAKIEQLPECYGASAYTSFYLLPTYWVREWFGLAHAFVFKD